jgi:hypothetical protein
VRRRSGIGPREARRIRRRRRARRSVAVVLLAAELAVMAALAVSVRSALSGRVTPAAAAPTRTQLTAATVAAHPRAYRARTVAVAGWVGINPPRRSARDRWAFLLLGRPGHPLLVVPADGATLTAFRRGTRVIVHGTVRLPHRHHLNRLAPSSRSRVAHRSHAPAIIDADQVTIDR